MKDFYRFIFYNDHVAGIGEALSEYECVCKKNEILGKKNNCIYIKIQTIFCEHFQNKHRKNLGGF